MNQATSGPQLSSGQSPVAPTSAASLPPAPVGQPSTAGAEPLHVPDHELLRLIASGAYGEVWLARNVIGTLRAVKIVRRDRHASTESFEREFKGLQRFEPVSRQHDGLVDILTLGLLPGGAGFYYVMELADQAEPEPNIVAAEVTRLASSKSGIKSEPPHVGCYEPRTLRADLKSRGAFPADEVIALGLKLTSALAHLHAQGLVHRDVKPSNILFVGGEPKLADAGLVAAVDDARSLVGTAGYIAPEGPGTPQADLYALGKVLYEGAFGKDRQEFPALPADVASRPDHARLLELNAILLRACATDDRDRYQSADKMRADLERLKAGHSVKRRQARERALKLVKQLTLTVGALAVVSAIVYLPTLRPARSSSFKSSPIAEANDEYKSGINELHLNVNGAEAIKHFVTAIQLDPKFADAYAQLAEAWYSIPGETNSKNGQEAAETAVKLDPESGLAHAAFAAAKVFTLDFSAAETEIKLAVQLSPDSEQVGLVSALASAALGRTTEALANLKRANEIGRDNSSKLRVIYSGFVYGWCREYDRAIAHYDANPWLKDAVDGPHAEQSKYYLAKGDYTNAMRLGRRSALERRGNLNQVNAEFDALEAAFRQGGSERYWRQRLEFESSKTGDHDWMNLAAIHAHLNHPGKALEYLRLAKQKTPAYFAIEINTDASFDGLRDDPQFRELIAELWGKK